ncbi:MAG: hypothetical protein ACUVT5_05005 [Candidatus Bathyarchaeales archaeon]
MSKSILETAEKRVFTMRIIHVHVMMDIIDTSMLIRTIIIMAY